MIALVVVTFVVAANTTFPAPAPGAVVAFNSPEGVARLERSKAKIDFFALADQFEEQQNAGLCGPTSGVIVLNALRIENDKIEKPVDKTAVPEDLLTKNPLPKGFDPYVHRYTQRAFFDDHLFKVKSKEVYYGSPAADGKRDGGLQIKQLGDVLKNHGLDVEVRIVDDKLDEAAAKRAIIENLQRANDYVIVNYHRGVLGQKGGGHISPLGAYDEQSDSFLILDVNPVEGKRWVWADAMTLFNAMRTKDHDDNRGFLLVREGSVQASK